MINNDTFWFILVKFCISRKERVRQHKLIHLNYTYFEFLLIYLLFTYYYLFTATVEYFTRFRFFVFNCTKPI